MSRPRTRKGHYISPSNIPGANGCAPPLAPFELCGVVWMPEDARPVGGSPIGLAMAMEWAAAEKTTSASEVAETQEVA